MCVPSNNLEGKQFDIFTYSERSLKELNFIYPCLEVTKEVFKGCNIFGMDLKYILYKDTYFHIYEVHGLIIWIIQLRRDGNGKSREA